MRQSDYYLGDLDYFNDLDRDFLAEKLVIFLIMIFIFFIKCL